MKVSKPARAALSVMASTVASALASSSVARPFTQGDMVGLDRVSDAHVSPDGRWAAYDLAVLDPAANTRRHSVWVVATDGKSAPVKWADGSTPRWAPDSRNLDFLLKGQIWSVCPTCAMAAPRQVTSLPLNVDSFRVAPDGRRLVVAVAVFPDTDNLADTKARLEKAAKAQATGRTYDKLFVRHWDSWANGTRNHLFALTVTDGVASGPPAPLMAGFDGDCPSKPSGGDDDFTITPDSRSAVFSARIAGRSEAWSTNFDLYRAPLDGSSPPANQTAANPAWDAGAVFSPDGTKTVYRAMKQVRSESDRFGIMIADPRTGMARELDPAWDRSARSLAFSGDGKSLYVLAGDVQQQKLFQMNLATGAVKAMTTGGHVASLDVAHAPQGDVIVYAADSMATPPEVFALRAGQAPLQLTHVDDRQLMGVEMTGYEAFEFKGWHGDPIHGWIMKPYGWKPGARYPTVLIMHGGPEGSQQDAWSTRWNPEVWAGWGYGVVMIDPHGSTGYGQAFTDAVIGHWGDRPLEDLQKGWAAAQAKAGWIDSSRACAAGFSYGGFMAYWIAGVWSEPWKCLVAHDGVFDTRMMGFSTEELWASEWELGRATPWERPEGYEAFNPVNHVAAWKTPMLVIHSELDFRLPIDQGIGAFTALQRQGVPSEFLTFPDENHWVLKPQNSLQWHDTIQAWLGRWIGPPSAPQ
jgi:dipeptidyl aminopeptidase/acylaminoacyl peptidase